MESQTRPPIGLGWLLLESKRNVHAICSQSYAHSVIFFAYATKFLAFIGSSVCTMTVSDLNGKIWGMIYYFDGGPIVQRDRAGVTKKFTADTALAIISRYGRDLEIKLLERPSKIQLERDLGQSLQCFLPTRHFSQ